MSKNMTELEGAANGNTIWRRRVACWISKATCKQALTHAHSTGHPHLRARTHIQICNIYYFSTARASVLRYTYIVRLFKTYCFRYSAVSNSTVSYEAYCSHTTQRLFQLICSMEDNILSIGQDVSCVLCNSKVYHSHHKDVSYKICCSGFLCHRGHRGHVLRALTHIVCLTLHTARICATVSCVSLNFIPSRNYVNKMCDLRMLLKIKCFWDTIPCRLVESEVRFHTYMQNVIQSPGRERGTLFRNNVVSLYFVLPNWK